MLLRTLLGVLLLASAPALAQPTTQPTTPAKFAIVLHAGAGPTPAPEEVEAYHAALTKALTTGRDVLAAGGTALDAVEKTVRILEDDPHFNAGKGAVYNAEGHHELDAAIMDGKTLNCGAVAGVSTIRNPISLARIVMEKSPHVLMMTEGAEKFADTFPSVERVPNTYFDTPKRFEQLQKVLEKRKQGENVKGHGTVGCVALDAFGNLAAATSTGGLTGKQFGRCGDTPIIGAGTYANNLSAAVSCTGTGEEFIRNAVAHDIAARVQYKGDSLQTAAHAVVFDILKPGDGGIIAVSHTGEIVMLFNTPSMNRAAADSSGRFEVSVAQK